MIDLQHDVGRTFSGDVHIHMNLTRPINIVSGEQPPTIYDVVNPGKRAYRSHPLILIREGVSVTDLVLFSVVTLPI